MRSNVFKTVLEWALITSLILSVYFFITFYFKSKQLRMFNSDMIRFQQNNTYANLLVADLVEYGKSHQDMLRLLESMGVGRQTPPPAGAPATPTKPPGK